MTSQPGNYGNEYATRH